MSIEYYSPFINSVKEIMKQMGNIDINVNDTVYSENDEIVSLGVTSIVSCVGKIKGRLLIDMEQSLAITIAQNVTGMLYDKAKEYMVLATISELNNTIAGDGITNLNNKYSLGLRLAPPIVFAGKDSVISIPKITSVSTNCTTRYGKLKVNVAFEGRE